MMWNYKKLWVCVYVDFVTSKCAYIEDGQSSPLAESIEIGGGLKSLLTLVTNLGLA